MFGDLYDYLSLKLSWGWPRAEGVITAVDFRPTPLNIEGTAQLQLAVMYEFWLGNDGPYTGESTWPTLLPEGNTISVDKKLRVGQAVAIRYRRDDPSVNKLDRSAWQAFESF
jgi:hypothetical protein